MKTTYSIEQIFRVFNDNTGEFIEIGPDADGIGLVEIRFVSSDGKIGDRIAATKEQMRMVAQSILNACDAMEKPEE